MKCFLFLVSEQWKQNAHERTLSLIFFMFKASILTKCLACVFYIGHCLFQQSSMRDHADEVQEGEI